MQHAIAEGIKAVRSEDLLEQQGVSLNTAEQDWHAVPARATGDGSTSRTRAGPGYGTTSRPRAILSGSRRAWPCAAHRGGAGRAGLSGVQLNESVAPCHAM